MESQGLKEWKSYDENETKTLTKEEQEAIGFYIKQARKARDQREMNWEYFDGMTYTQDYISNRRAKNSYLRPKKNDVEVRVVGGATEKKIEVVANELIRINLQPEIRAFDEVDNEMYEFGEDLTSLIKRLNEIERDDDFWQAFIEELLSQRAVFIQEYVDYEYTNGNKSKKSVEYKIPVLKKRILTGLKVFLGDITIPSYRFKDQPYIVLYDRTTFKEAKRIYGDNENFKYVKPKGNYEVSDLNTWAIAELETDECEILTYISTCDNEYNVIINGVPMFKSGSPIPKDFDGYNMVMVVLKSMSEEFAYGKPLTASAKTLQAFSDESLRMMITKFQQALKPSYGVSEAKAKIFSRDIWAPATIVQGVTANDFTRLTDHQGVTQSEFNFYQLIDTKVQEFIGAGQNQQGLESKSNTATESQIQQQQFLKQLGYSVLAMMRAKRDATYLRINSTLKQHTEPYKKRVNPITNEIENVFRRFTVSNEDLGFGQFGRKEIEFTDKQVGEEDLMNLREEERTAEEMGEPFRRKYLNVDILKNFKWFFYVVINQKPEESSALDKAMFKEKLADAMNVAQISGRQLKGDKIVEDFGRLNKAKDWFEDRMMAPPMTQPGGEMAQAQQGMVGAQLAQGTEPQMPSVNTMASQFAQ